MAKQHKPFWRFRNIAIMVFFGPLALIVVAIGWAVTRPAGQAGKYADEIDRLVQARQPSEGPNGWTMLLEALDARVAAEREFGAALATAGRFSPGSNMYEAWWVPSGDKDTDSRNTEERRADVKAIIEELRAKGVLDKHAAFARTARAVRPKPEGEVYSVLLPELGMMRQSARLLGARYALAAEEGNVDEMIASYEQLIAIAKVAKAQFTLIDHLVGIAIESLANERVREMMMLHPLEGEKGTRLAKAILAVMDREQALMARVDHAFAGERLSVLDAVEWTHTDDGSGGGVLIVTMVDLVANGTGGATSMSSLRQISGALAGLAFRGKAGTVERVNMMMEKTIATSRLPRVSREMVSIEDTMMLSLTWRDRLLSTLLPALGRSLKSQDQTDLTRLGLRTMLALELFRIREGHYPARLEELVGRDLPMLAEDPIAGGLLRYKLLGSGVVDPSEWSIPTDQKQRPDTRGYLLYSVGDDGVDNGGLVRSGNGNFDAINGRGKPRAQGVDYQINLRVDGSRRGAAWRK